MKKDASSSMRLGFALGCVRPASLTLASAALLIPPEVSYVLEPFEQNAATETGQLPVVQLGSVGSIDFNISSSEHKYGEAALQVTLRDKETANAGGTFGSFVQASEPAHNCIGATHLSLWYKQITQGSNVLLTVSLYDDSDCASCLEHFTSLEEAAAPRNGTSDWNEMQIKLPEYGSESDVWTPVSGNKNRTLALDHIRGWSISARTAQDVGAPQQGVPPPLVLWIDQLACVGGGELFGAPFKTGDSFQSAVKSNALRNSFFKSDLSRNGTKTVLQDGFLKLDYVLEQAEVWGGYISYGFRAPANAYYNLSLADSVQLSYDVTRPAVPAERAHLRLIIYDADGCRQECRDAKELEIYYSFHEVLSSEPNVDGQMSQIAVYLNGDADQRSPFYLTGWSGTMRDGVLDPSRIKGLALELNVNDQGSVGSLVTGAISVGNVTAVSRVASSSSRNVTIAECLVPEFGLYANELSAVFTKHTFVKNCCERCDADDNCRYAFFSGEDCFTAPYLAADTITLATLEVHSTRPFYAKKAASALGDFCDLCECKVNEGAIDIDCRGRNLNSVPKTFTPQSSDLKARRLDFRDNPRLHLLPSDSLSSVADSLVELQLPEMMQYIAPNNIVGLKQLSKVRFEGAYDIEDGLGGMPAVKNVIAGAGGFFGEICCGLGEHATMEFPSQGLTFCDMKVDKVGEDVVYEPYINYFQADEIAVLTHDSPFMAEAAQSAEKCAEYCKVTNECRFFEYDERFQQAIHACRLLRSTGRPTFACCDDLNYYADAEMTRPGYTAGRPPRTRHELDGAKVLIAPFDVTADTNNGFTSQYEVSLGSAPLRGAVWVEPALASLTVLDVVITPPRVVLYDNATTAIVSVQILNAEEIAGTTERLVLRNSVESCDEAFTYFVRATDNNVFVSVVGPTRSGVEMVALLVPLVAVFLLSTLGFYALYERKKKQGDAIWTIKSSELQFFEPPRVLGSGTFGLVLLAEYRGTQVAVKRVLPMLKDSKGAEKSCDPTCADSGSSGSSGEHTVDVETGKRVDAPARDTTKNLGTSTLAASRAASTAHVRKREWLRLKESFIEEMRTISKIRHPCVTTVMGSIVVPEPMLIMEYMEHGSLYDLLHNNTVAMEGELLLPILRDVARGMRFLHACSPQVIHGDIKAANILVDNKFRAKVADFGLTQKGQVGARGTPFWMAPELLRGETGCTPQSDIYSFGVVLCEVYSREDPYKDEKDHDEVLSLIMDLEINKRPAVPSTCPIKAQILLTECLSANPFLRPTFEELDLQLSRLDVETIEPGKLNDADMDRSNGLLETIFPKHIAQALRDGKKVEPEKRDIVTVLYSEMVGYNALYFALGPAKISNLMERLHNALDKLSQTHGVYKVQTVGGAYRYMAVSNLVKDQPDHVKRIAEFAVGAVNAANETLIDPEEPGLGYVRIRLGLDSGPVLANVVGSICPRYCLFGNVVNVASQLESTSGDNRIHCSERSARLLMEQCPEMPVYERGLVSVKTNKILTYWVNETQLDSLVEGMGSLHSLHTPPSSKRRSSQSPSRRRLPILNEDNDRRNVAAEPSASAVGATGIRRPSFKTHKPESVA